MAILAFARKSEVPAARDFLFDGPQIRSQFVIARDAQFSIFKIRPHAESEFLLDPGREDDRLDFPTEPFAGAFGQLQTQAGRVNAGTLNLWQTHQSIKLRFNFRKCFALQLDSQAIPDDIANSLAEIEYAKVFFSRDIDAKEK